MSAITCPRLSAAVARLSDPDPHVVLDAAVALTALLEK